MAWCETVWLVAGLYDSMRGCSRCTATVGDSKEDVSPVMDSVGNNRGVAPVHGCSNLFVGIFKKVKAGSGSKAQTRNTRKMKR